MIQTKKEFFRDLSERTGVPQNELTRIYGHMVDMIFDSSSSKDESTTILPYIGKIQTRVQPVYASINPRNSQRIMVPAKLRVNLKLFPKFIETVRNN